MRRQTDMQLFLQVHAIGSLVRRLVPWTLGVLEKLRLAEAERS